MNIESLSRGFLNTGRAKTEQEAHRMAVEILSASGMALPESDTTPIVDTPPVKYVPTLKEAHVKSTPEVFRHIGQSIKAMYAAAPNYRGPVCTVKCAAYTVTARVDSNGKVKLKVTHANSPGKIPEVEFTDRMLAKIMHNPSQAALVSYASTLLPADPRAITPMSMSVTKGGRWLATDARLGELNKDAVEFEDEKGRRVKFQPERDEDGIVEDDDIG